MAATITIPTICSKSPLNPLRNPNINAALCTVVPGRHNVAFCIMQEEPFKRLPYLNQPRAKDHRSILKPICAVGSGLPTKLSDSKGSTLDFKQVKIAVESQDSDKIKLRVDLNGEETKNAFDVVLSNLSNSAPVLPGFRRQKGGKTCKVPKNLVLDIFGKDRVMQFVIQEMLTSIVAKYVEEENLSVRENKISTTQTEDELKQSFVPGKRFGFNVELELATEETESEETETTVTEGTETTSDVS